jgi:asparagine synthase (glutamine-hydrolysing)
VIVVAGGSTGGAGERWWHVAGEALGPVEPGDADGVYAAAIWDGARALLTCDPLGFGALFLARHGSALLFASELGGLVALLDRAPEPDAAALRRWLALNQTAPGETLLRGVERLRAGRQLVLGREVRTRPHRRPVRPPRVPAADAPAAVRDGVIRAVGRRCPAGETVAVQLSGGLDSTVVAATAARALPPDRRPHAHYSVLFPGFRDQDESDWIAVVAGQLGIRSVRMTILGGSVLAGTLDWAAGHATPLMAPNWFYQRPLMQRIAADGATAVLDGEGGDELFAAPLHLLADDVRHGRLLRAWRHLHAIPGASGASLRRRTRVFSEYALRGALPYALHRRLPHRSPADEFEARWEWQRRPGPRWSAYLSWVLTDGVARFGALDHFRLRAASAGMHARHPLFDVELAELVFSLPPELALDSLYSRPLLRRSMRGIAPEAILLRTGKARFDAFVVESLRGPDRAALGDLLGARAHVREHLPPDWVAGIAEPPPDNRGLARWASRAFRAAAAECWLRTREDAGFPERFRERHGLVACRSRFEG